MTEWLIRSLLINKQLKYKSWTEKQPMFKLWKRFRPPELLLKTNLKNYKKETVIKDFFPVLQYYVHGDKVTV